MNTTGKEGYEPIVQGLRPGLNDGEEPPRLEKVLQEERIVRLLGDPTKIRQTEGVTQRMLTGDLVDTAPMIRTAPLWGLRVRPQLLHDGSALTIDEAIRRHSGQAEKVKLNYVFVLTQQERDQLLAFLKSL